MTGRSNFVSGGKGGEALKLCNSPWTAATALTRDGLFIGQSHEFFEALGDLAADADRARRDI